MASSRGSSSSSSSSTGASDPVQAALDAAKQLSSIWRAGPHAQLLQRPPVAAWAGKAAEPVERSISLLQALHDALTQGHPCDDSAAKTEQLLKGLQQHQLAGVLARLLVWLQQRPEVRLHQPAGSSSTSNIDSSSSSVLLWHWCMVVLRAVCDITLGVHVWNNMCYMENFTCAMDKAGGEQRCSVLSILQGYLHEGVSCCAYPWLCTYYVWCRLLPNGAWHKS
jgi:hypothetical protein